MTSATPKSGDDVLQIQFDDNRLLQVLYGEHDQHLARIEHDLEVSLVPRGNRIAISGPAAAVAVARDVLEALYGRLARGLTVDAAEVDAAMRLALHAAENEEGGALLDEFGAGGLTIRTRKRNIVARSPRQAAYIRAMGAYGLVFSLGPAGTGKTYLAVAMAVSMLVEGAVDRIILSRPAVEAGERLGFLPGDLREKVDPYLRPLYDALHDMLPGDQVVKRMTEGDIEVAPLGFMRGRTLSNAFIILDEAQNTTAGQMKMFLTRLGENSRMVVTGDMSQVDLPIGQRSGLREAAIVLQGVEGVTFVRFTDADVVRHPLVTRIVRAYDAHDRRHPRGRARRTAGVGGGSAGGVEEQSVAVGEEEDEAGI